MTRWAVSEWRRLIGLQRVIAVAAYSKKLTVLAEWAVPEWRMSRMCHCAIPVAAYSKKLTVLVLLSLWQSGQSQLENVENDNVSTVREE